MDDKDKNKLYLMTSLLDSAIIYILIKKNLHFLDKSFFIATLLTHATFFYALKNNKRKILDFLHYFVFILPICSLFTKSLYPKILSLFLLIIIQFLWVIENRCILNEKNQDFGFGDYTSIATITLNTLLSFQIGKLI
jgi:hypothetical protein